MFGILFVILVQIGVLCNNYRSKSGDSSTNDFVSN